MTDYVKTVDFAAKDGLASGNPLKLVLGTEINTEFANIATAVATKADSASPTLTTPNIGTPSAGTLTNCIGLPIVAGTTGTLSVARGGTGVTTSTGSGNVVLSTSPTLVTPNLGTPSTLVGTNITGTAAGLTVGTATNATNATNATTATNLNGGTINGTTAILSASVNYAVLDVTNTSAANYSAIIGTVNNAQYAIQGVATAPGGAGILGWAQSSGNGVVGQSALAYGVVAVGDTSSPIKSSFRIAPQDTAPSSPLMGDIYCNSGTGVFYGYNGSSWQILG